MPRRTLATALALATTAAVATTAAATGGGTLFYTWPSAIGKVQADGTGAVPSFVPITGQNEARIGAGGGYVFWSRDIGGSFNIVRAPQAGGAAETIITGACAAVGTIATPPPLAATSAHLYYGCATSNNGSSIARAGLDGSAKDENYLAPSALGPLVPRALAVNESAVYAAGGNRLVRFVGTAGGSFSMVLTPSGPSAVASGLALDSAHVYWTDTVNNRIGRLPLEFQPGVVSASDYFINGLADPPETLASDGSYLFWVVDDSNTSRVVARAGIDGTNINPAFVPATSGGDIYDVALGASGGSGGATPATPSTTPAAGSTADGPASLLRPITRTNTRQAARQGATQVAAPVDLKDAGRYTFIFETRAGSTERWTQMQATGKRVVQLRNSRIGKRKLTRNSTAPTYSTTAANKRLVVVALIKKAQAGNLRLRVIHRAANGTLTQDVFNA